MQCDWQASAIQGNTIRIRKCDSSEVREVNCADLIYMPFKILSGQIKSSDLVAHIIVVQIRQKQ